MIYLDHNATMPLLPDGLYRDMPQLIGQNIEDVDWQRLAIEGFFQDNETDHG